MTTSSPSGVAPLDKPAAPDAEPWLPPVVKTSAHGAIHVDVGAIVDPLLSSHYGGRYSWRIATGNSLDVWLTGTPDDLRTFACRLVELADVGERSAQ